MDLQQPNPSAGPPFSDEQLADMSPNAANMFAFEQLRWPVFGPVSVLRVLDDAGDAQSTLRPFDRHPIASALVTKPPRAAIRIAIDSLANREAENGNDEECRYKAPEPLDVRNFDGSPITLGDFVAAVHPYLQAYEKEIIDYDGELLGYMPRNEQYYFDGVIDPGKNDTDEVMYLSLCLTHDGADGKSIDEQWAEQAEMVRSRRQHGFGTGYSKIALAYLEALQAAATSRSVGL